MNENRGITLIEMLITLALLAILTTIAIPTYDGVVAGNRASAQLGSFLQAVEYARSVAMKRGLDATICASSNDATCAPAGSWTQGWIVFSDPNNNKTPATPGSILRVHGTLSGNSQLTGNANIKLRITFNRFGLLAGVYNGTITLLPHPDRTGLRRCMTLSSVGRITTASGGQCP